MSAANVSTMTILSVIRARMCETASAAAAIKPQEEGVTSPEI